MFSTPLGGFFLLFEALHIRFCPCRCSFGFGPSSAWFSSVPVLCTPRYTLKTIFRISLRQKITNLRLKSFAPVVFAYNKRLPSSWNFYSMGRSMDELGNFGHMSVPIMEGPGHCLRLKNGALFLDYDWFRRSAYDELFYKFLFFQNAHIALLLGGSIGSFLSGSFFCPAGHLSTSRIHWWIVRNYSYVFRMDRS